MTPSDEAVDTLRTRSIVRVLPLVTNGGERP
jgi:hypothetical protein